MNKIAFYYRRTEEEILKRLHCVKFYYTRVGLKNVGAGYLLGANNITLGSIIEIPTDKLFLGPDYLNNQNTLLNCGISQSPHYEFVKTIMEDGDLSKTEYIQRFVSGRLDWRRGSTKPRDFSYFNRMYLLSQNEIQANDYEPVIVYSLNGVYYIFDGKHRAALCANLNIPVRCNIVGSEIANANVWHYMFSIVKGKPDFSRHTEFHDIYLNELSKYGKQ